MKNNKENNYFYKNRKVLVASILFFIACFIILTVATNTKAEDNVTDFTLPEGAETVDIVIHTEVDDNGNKTPLSNVGIKIARTTNKVPAYRSDCDEYKTDEYKSELKENYDSDSYLQRQYDTFEEYYEYWIKVIDRSCIEPNYDYDNICDSGSYSSSSGCVSLSTVSTFYIEDYVNFNKSENGYMVDSLTDYIYNATQINTDENGDLKIIGIPEGKYMIYESMLSESNTSFIKPLNIVIRKEEGKLKLYSINNFCDYDEGCSSSPDILVSNQNNNIVINLFHKKTNESSILPLARSQCLMSASGGKLMLGPQSGFKIEKEVYPPTLNDWEANLKVNAYLDGAERSFPGGELTQKFFLSFDDYCKWYRDENYANYLNENYEEYYMHYYDEYEKSMKDKYGDEYNKHLERQEEYYNSSSYLQSQYDNFEEYCKTNYYSCYSTLEKYVENIHRSEYEPYEEYLEKNYKEYYLVYYNEFEEYLNKTYKDEYNEYIKDGYETVNLYKKSGNITELNNTESFSTCIEPSEVRRSNGSMYIDVLEAVDENYVVNYSANIPGLKQENNRYYGTIKNAIGHEIVVKATNWDKNYGDLQITKKLFGLNGAEETDKEFTFKVTLTPPEGETLEEKYLYNTSEDSDYKDLVLINEQGNVKSVNVTIKAGGSIRLIGLPAGTTYKVEETDIDGYQVNSQNAEGVIVGATLLDVFFTNTKAKTGLLTVTKKVIDTDLERDKVRDEEFTFIVTLNDKNINGKYGEMEFKDGVATFTLRDGESKSAINIPENTTYEVTEEAVNGYDVTKEGDKGTIEDGVEKKVLITNTKAIMSPNTSDSILIALILILISLGTVIFFRIRKKELL